MITRTIAISDLTPTELAEAFCEMWNGGQAEFFAEIGKIARGWPGAGWCQQSYSITTEMTKEGRDVIQTLASHVLDCDDLVGAVAKAKDTPTNTGEAV